MQKDEITFASFLRVKKSSNLLTVIDLIPGNEQRFSTNKEVLLKTLGTIEKRSIETLREPLKVHGVVGIRIVVNYSLVWT